MDLVNYPDLPSRGFLFPETAEKVFNNLCANWNCIHQAKSLEGHNIKAYQFGEGAISVLIWTQMHGNEPTATYALSDFLYFLQKNKAEVDEIFAHCRVTIIPVLNPDGAALHQRENAIGVDLNRDIRSVSCPETRFFLEILEKVKPDWAFNMHDQRNLFSVSDSGMPATLSLLAPSIPEHREQSENRDAAMALIGHLVNGFSDEEKRHTARFDDAFYPLATGDYLQEEGIKTILVESGGMFDDPLREIARKRVGKWYVEALKTISSGYVPVREDKETYQLIPENSMSMRDLIIRDVEVKGFAHTPKVDLAFTFSPIIKKNKLQYRLSLSEVGVFPHLSPYYLLKGPFIWNQKRDKTLKQSSYYLKEEFPPAIQKTLKANEPTLWNLLV